MRALDTMEFELSVIPGWHARLRNTTFALGSPLPGLRCCAMVRAGYLAPTESNTMTEPQTQTPEFEAAHIVTLLREHPEGVGLSPLCATLCTKKGNTKKNREALEKFLTENQEAGGWEAKGPEFWGLMAESQSQSQGPPQGELDAFKRVVVGACEIPAQKLSQGLIDLEAAEQAVKDARVELLDAMHNEHMKKYAWVGSDGIERISTLTKSERMTIRVKDAG